jgi:hypothetical protein
MKHSGSIKPPLFARLAIAVNGEHNGWLKCPYHGYVYQPLLSGYHGPYYYRKCPVGPKHYWVDLADPPRANLE